MPNPPVDPFPTVTLKVPYLKETLDLLRDPALERVVVILHTHSAEESEWVLANVAARLARSRIPTFGPEQYRPVEMIEQALREKKRIALVGDIRRVEDGHAMKTAAGMGLRLVATVPVIAKSDFENVVAELGPWRNVNLSTFTRG